MKKLLAILLALAAGPALAQVSPSEIAPANTMLGNWSGSAAPLANKAMPTCADTGGNHLNYVAGTGITCGSTGGSTGITLISTQTASSSSDLNWTGLSAIAYYRLTCNSLVLSVAGGNVVYLQIGTGAGPSWQTSSYDTLGYGNTVANYTVSNQYGSNFAASITMMNDSLPTSSPGNLFVMDIHPASGTGDHLAVTGAAFLLGTTSAHGVSTSFFGSWEGGGDATTAIRVKASAGTISTGSCSLYRYSN